MCIINKKYITFKSKVELLVEVGLPCCRKCWISSKIGEVGERRGEKRVKKREEMGIQPSPRNRGKVWGVWTACQEALHLAVRLG